MIRHILMYDFKEGTTQEQIDAMFRGFQNLMKEQPGIKTFTAGKHLQKDSGGRSPRYPYCMVMDFDTIEDTWAYTSSEGHDKVVAQFCVPIVAHLTAVDYDTSTYGPEK